MRNIGFRRKTYGPRMRLALAAARLVDIMAIELARLKKVEIDNCKAERYSEYPISQ